MVSERIGTRESESDQLWMAWQERGAARDHAMRKRWTVFGVVAAVGLTIVAVLW
jgi:hypothetical protein